MGALSKSTILVRHPLVRFKKTPVPYRAVMPGDPSFVPFLVRSFHQQGMGWAIPELHLASPQAQIVHHYT